MRLLHFYGTIAACQLAPSDRVQNLIWPNLCGKPFACLNFKLSFWKSNLLNALLLNNLLHSDWARKIWFLKLTLCAQTEDEPLRLLFSKAFQGLKCCDLGESVYISVRSALWFSQWIIQTSINFWSYFWMKLGLSKFRISHIAIYVANLNTHTHERHQLRNCSRECGSGRQATHQFWQLCACRLTHRQAATIIRQTMT